ADLVRLLGDGLPLLLGLRVLPRLALGGGHDEPAARPRWARGERGAARRGDDRDGEEKGGGAHTAGDLPPVGPARKQGARSGRERPMSPRRDMIRPSWRSWTSCSGTTATSLARTARSPTRCASASCRPRGSPARSSARPGGGFATWRSRAASR